MKRRIMGNEHEYTLTETPSSDHSLLAKRFLSFLPYAVSFDEVTYQKRYLHSLTHDREALDLYTGRQENTDMLQNQARAYFDPPNAEYATQECDNVFDLISCEKAGEKLFSGALSMLREALKNISPNVSIRLFKNNRAYRASTRHDGVWSTLGSQVNDLANYEDKFSTCGTHDNYIIARTGAYDRLRHFFIPHLIALSIFTGGGCVEYNTKKQRFEFSRSQRFPWIRRPIGQSAQASRSFLIFRETENFAPDQYQRMQVISGDANLCEAALLIKYATSAAILEMIEDDSFYVSDLLPEIEKKFAWANTEHFLAMVAQDAATKTLDELLPTKNYAWTLRDLATFFAEMRERYDQKIGFSKDIRAGLSLEQELLKKLSLGRESDESRILTPYSDHAFMHEVIRRDMARYGYSYESSPNLTLDFPANNGSTTLMTVSHRFRYLEAVCHEIDPGMSRFDKAKRRGLFHTVVTPDTIDAMMTGAPATTRANRRKIIVDELRAKNKLANCRWIGVTSLNNNDESRGQELPLLDPFTSQPTPEDRNYFESPSSKAAD